MVKKKESEAVALYRTACDGLARAVNTRLFEDGRDWYWVGGDAGGLCDFDGVDFLTPEDMALVLECDVEYDEYAAWRDANLDNQDKGYINLRSWLMGCRHWMLDGKEDGDEEL